PGNVGSYPAFLTDVNGTLFFIADDGKHGPELWKSDGTAAGTVLVKDVRPGPIGSQPIAPDRDPEAPIRYNRGLGGLTAVGDTLCLAAAGGEHGEQLWKSDGTPAGSALVKDVRPGRQGSRLIHGNERMAPVGGALYFAADDGKHGRQLWKSDGTPEGTVMV